MNRLILKHLTFTGPGVQSASLTFSGGLNVIYGASNTGKSFAAKALNFMFGGSQPLPGIEQRVDYDAVWMGLQLPDGTEITVYRATAGGNFRVLDGLVSERLSESQGAAFQAQHDARREDNLSRYLLQSLNLDSRVIAKNMHGEKESFSFRNLAPYMFVSEEAIISERSPVLHSGQVISETAEKNAFKLLLTGRDDKAVVTTQKPREQRVARLAKVELVDEWIAQADEELGDFSEPRAETERQLERLEASMAAIQTNLRASQDQLDKLVAQRRQLLDAKEIAASRLLELELTLERFERLAQIYTSDIQRLQALEEGGLLLMAVSGRSCPVCGAAPEAQRHTHGADEIKRSREAAVVEIQKIEVERRDLQATSQSLSAEADGLRKRVGTIGNSLSETERELEEVRPQETRARHSHEAILLRRSEIVGKLALLDQRERLEAQRIQLAAQRPRQGQGNERLAVGIDGTTAFEFSKTVQSVLTSWNFPNASSVRFDLARQDIEVGGKERAANGKGVRAVLHAAFKVATLIYCFDNGLSHPGILVLDTPLLTYREPLAHPRHAEVAPDEIALRETGLADRFYAYLMSLADIAQFVVLENADPPSFVRDNANLEVFTGRVNIGRFGFFPPLTTTKKVPVAA